MAIQRRFRSLGWAPLLTILCVPLCVQEASGISRETLMTQRCGTCHMGWLQALEGKEISATQQDWDLSRLRRELEVKVPQEVCYGCHDGFILDSRERVWTGKPHSAGKKPSSRVQVPNTFPLNPRGEVYCGTCHSPHGGSELNVEFAGRQFLRAENLDSHICKSCHHYQLDAPKHRNHPVDVLGEKPVSEEVFRRGGRLGSDPRKVICQSCHSPHGKSTLVGEIENSALCIPCHQDKLRKENLFQNGSPLHPVNVKADRGLWEAANIPENARIGREGSLICSTCHSMHEGKASSMLLLEDQASFCDVCHREQAESLAGTKHDLRKSAPNAQNLRGESPEKSGSCRACHLAHGWAQEAPAGADPLSGTCLSCHQAEGWAKEERIGTFSHPVNVEVKSESADPSLPLWTGEGTPKVVCSSCHDPHRYAPGVEVNRQPLNADGDATNSFLRAKGPALCGGCHIEQEQIQDTKHDLRLYGKPLAPEHRKGIELGGACMGCHRVHNAQGEKLWFEPLRPATREFDLHAGTRRCLSCHRDADMKRIEEGRGHPVGKAIEPEYMPGPADALKLGDTTREGHKIRVVICSTCHLPHGRKTEDGGSPLIVENGSSPQQLCVACHRNQRKVIGSLHDFRTRKAGAYVPDQERSGKYGPCAGCHAAHYAGTEERLLWFEVTEPKGRGNPEDMPCLYCHGNPKVMEGRHAEFYVHPRGAEVKQIIEQRIQEGEIPPLAEIDGRGAAKIFLPGYEAIFHIRCTTCHDGHEGTALWMVEDGTFHKDPEITSFLRGPSVPQTLCSTCHGQEALYRYRYFHQERAFRHKVPDK
jgi:predicted CXXCH cytochrome family protein